MSHFSKLGSRRGGGIMVLALIAGAVAYYFLLHRPGTQAIDQLRSTLQAKREFIVRTESLRPTLARSEEELARVRDYYDRWAASAPRESDLPAVYARIHERFDMAGATSTHFEPQEMVAMQSIRQMPVALGAAGTLEQLFALLGGLEQLPEAIWLEDLQFESTGQEGEAVDCEARLVIFANDSGNSD